MPTDVVKIELTPALLRGAWVAFFIVGFFFIVSLLSYLKIMRSLNLQLDFLVYLKSLLQEIRSAMREGEGTLKLEDLDKGREPPTRPAQEGPKGEKG